MTFGLASKFNALRFAPLLDRGVAPGTGNPEEERHNGQGGTGFVRQ